MSEDSARYVQPGKETDILRDWQSKLISTTDENDIKLIEKEINHFVGLKRNYAGDMLEKKFLEILKKYFLKRNEEFIIFHSYPFYKLDYNDHKNKINEKDFLIANLSHRYIMPIEVKRTLGKLSIGSIIKQLTDAKSRFDSWYPNLRGGWHWIPMAHFESFDANEQFCEKLKNSNQIIPSKEIGKKFKTPLNKLHV